MSTVARRHNTARTPVLPGVAELSDGAVARKQQTSAASKAMFGWTLLLAIWLLVLYAPSFSGPYHFDDLGFVVDNSAIQSFPLGLRWHRPENRPVAVATFAIDHLLWNGWPAANRVTNVLVHVIASTFLAIVIYKLATISIRSNSDGKRDQVARWPLLLAVSTATLWAVHPLNSQAVAYIVQRCESLMGLFFFAFLWAIVRHEETRRWPWLIVAAVLFYLGIASKTVMVTALAVGPLVDRIWLSDSWLEVLRKRAVLYLPPLFFGIVAIMTLLPGIMRGDANVGFGGDAPPATAYMAGQAEVIARYFALSVFPVGLNIDHDFLPPDPWQQSLPWIISLTIVCIIGLAIYFLGSRLTSRHRSIAFFLLAPLLVLSPTSSFIPTADLMVEHRMYVPLAAIVVGAVLLVIRISAVVGNRQPQSPAITRGSQPLGPRTLLLAATFALAFCFFSYSTWSRAHDYQSGVRLWYSALLLNTNNARAAQNLTNSAIAEDQQEALLQLFVTAHEHAQRTGQPTNIVLGRIGEELVKRNAAKEALQPLEQAIAADPSPEQLEKQFYSPSRRSEFAAHRINMGLALASLQQFPDSIAQFEAAFAINDDFAEARAIVGDLTWRLGQTEQSIAHFQRALELRPDWPEVQQQLAVIQNQATQQP